MKRWRDTRGNQPPECFCSLFASCAPSDFEHPISSDMLIAITSSPEYLKMSVYKLDKQKIICLKSPPLRLHY